MTRGLLLATLLCAACDSAPSTTAILDLDRKLDFYALPFPNDLRLTADGRIDLHGYPSGFSTEVDRYVAAFEQRLDGWGTQAAIYFRFDGPIDPASLPSVAASREATSSVVLVDVTPTSPTYGQRQLVECVFHPDAGNYIGANWLSVRPMPGRPLRSKTTYAALILDGVRDPHGARLHAAASLKTALSSSGPLAYAPLRAFVATQPELAPHVVSATVFTTQDATGPMRRLREAIYKKAPTPMVKNLVHVRDTSTFAVYHGEYDAPNFQSGEVPYFVAGGRILDDPADGLPLVQRTETMRVALTIPLTTMPPAGWPLVIYAHGTGGDYESFIEDRSANGVARVADADGVTLAEMAMISIDQPLHGTRDSSGMGPDLFLNLGNAEAIFDNFKQAAADDYSLVRLLPSFDGAIRFDPDRVYYKGHSQGGITGALFLPAEPQIKAAILSGTGGNLLQTLLDKEMYRTVLQLLIDGPVDETHPVLNLLQTFAESSDPTNYAEALFARPTAGAAPKSLFVSMGQGDTDTPNATTWSYAVAMGAQPIGPELVPLSTLPLTGLQWGTPPTMNNVADHTATGVLLQYQPPTGRDGHFVIFDVAAARDQSNRFLASHAKTAVATVYSP